MEGFNQTIQITRYANVLMDDWFKRSFGSENNKRLTILLLQELIPERKISSISFAPQEHINPIEHKKDIRVDIECTEEDGTRFMVEMQVEPQGAFYERAIFNSTFAVQQQMEKGPTTYDFPPVYFIGVLKFSLHPGADRVLFRYNLRESKSGELMSDRLNFIFLELPNCKNVARENYTRLDRLSHTLLNMEKINEAPEDYDDEMISLLLKSAETINFAPEERAKYIHDMTTQRDIQNQIDYALQKGLAEGVAKGKAEGKAEERIQMARKMLADKLPADVISKYTGLREEDIAAL